MDHAREGRFDSVLVTRLARFARSLRHLHLTLEELRRLGVDFVSLEDGIDTSGPGGEVVLSVVKAVAGLERDLHSQRVQAGLRRAQEEGKGLGRPRVQVDLSEVQRLHAKGLSLRSIGRRLKISKSTVARLLKSDLIQVSAD